MQMLPGVGIHPLLTVESQIDQSEHIECGQSGGDESDHPQNCRAIYLGGEGLPQDLILGKESGETGYS